MILALPPNTAQPIDVLLARIKSVDGHTSGLDADLLDGKHASAFALVAHTHGISDVTGLQTALDGKSATGHTHTPSQVGLGNLPNAKSDSVSSTSSSVLATSAGVKTAYDKGVSAESNVNTHKSDSGNPHGVTKTQVGLGNIPNSVSSSIASTSTTTLATSKAVKDVNDKVNTHNGRTDNPHGVTQAQIGYTAADVLAKIKTVDGSGSGLDADLLDGQHGSFYRSASNLNAGTVPKTRLRDNYKPVDHYNLGTDCNNMRDPATGYFVRSANNANCPVTYGVLFVFHSYLHTAYGDGAKYITQVIFPHNSDTICIRHSGGNGTTWSAWKTIADSDDIAALQAAINGKAPTSHNHPISNVTGLQTALDGKAASDHTHSGIGPHSHAISDVTNLQSALDGKAATHSHPYVPTSTYTAADILAKLKTVDGAGSGLDADTLDGAQPSANAGNNTIVKRHSSGYIYGNYFNGTGTFSRSGASSGMAVFTGGNGTDDFGRSYTPAAARAALNVENGATADQSASEILNLLKTVDGDNSGLDADLIRGMAPGACDPVSATTDPNLATKELILSKHANGPNSSYYYYIRTQFWSTISTTGRRAQIAISYNCPQIEVWARHYNGGWLPWVRLDADNWVTKSAAFTAAVNTKYYVDTSAGVVNVTLPPTPPVGTTVTIHDVAGTFHTNKAQFLYTNSMKIMGLAESMECTTRYQTVTLSYSGATYGWRIVE